MKVFRNGIRHPPALRKQAVALRKNGYTHREITRQLGISLGTADLWTAGIVLSQAQKEAIQQRKNKHIFTDGERGILAKRLKPFQYQIQYSDQDLIMKIKDFHSLNGRIHLKKEFGALKIYRDRFGSWNNAIELAGFDSNPVLFARKFIAEDRHPCDSFTEKIIDDWLYKHNIPHSRNIVYGKTKMTADFLIEPSTVLEFFGLAGVQKKYDAIIQRKRRLAKKLGWNLIELYPTKELLVSSLEKLFL